MTEMKQIVKLVSPKSLIIIDELCRATSTEEGTGIAWAVSEHLLQTTAFTFLTTHFIALSKLSDIYSSVTNYHLEALLDDETNEFSMLVYTHKLLLGPTRLEYYGLRLARASSLPEDIVQHAIVIASILNTVWKPTEAYAGAEYYAKMLQNLWNNGQLTTSKIDEIKSDIIMSMPILAERLSVINDVKDGGRNQQETKQNEFIRRDMPRLNLYRSFNANCDKFNDNSIKSSYVQNNRFDKTDGYTTLSEYSNSNGSHSVEIDDLPRTSYGEVHNGIGDISPLTEENGSIDDLSDETNNLLRLCKNANSLDKANRSNYFIGGIGNCMENNLFRKETDIIECKEYGSSDKSNFIKSSIILNSGTGINKIQSKAEDDIFRKASKTSSHGRNILETSQLSNDQPNEISHSYAGNNVFNGKTVSLTAVMENNLYDKLSGAKITRCSNESSLNNPSLNDELIVNSGNCNLRNNESNNSSNVGKTVLLSNDISQKPSTARSDNRDLDKTSTSEYSDSNSNGSSCSSDSFISLAKRYNESIFRPRSIINNDREIDLITFHNNNSSLLDRASIKEFVKKGQTKENNLNNRTRNSSDCIFFESNQSNLDNLDTDCSKNSLNNSPATSDYSITSNILQNCATLVIGDNYDSNNDDLSNRSCDNDSSCSSNLLILPQYNYNSLLSQENEIFSNLQYDNAEIESNIFSDNDNSSFDKNIFDETADVENKLAGEINRSNKNDIFRCDKDRFEKLVDGVLLKSKKSSRRSDDTSISQSDRFGEDDNYYDLNGAKVSKCSDLDSDRSGCSSGSLTPLAKQHNRLLPQQNEYKIPEIYAINFCGDDNGSVTCNAIKESVQKIKTNNHSLNLNNDVSFECDQGNFDDFHTNCSGNSSKNTSTVSDYLVVSNDSQNDAALTENDDYDLKNASLSENGSNCGDSSDSIILLAKEFSCFLSPDNDRTANLNSNVFHAVNDISVKVSENGKTMLQNDRANEIYTSNNDRVLENVLLDNCDINHKDKLFFNSSRLPYNSMASNAIHYDAVVEDNNNSCGHFSLPDCDSLTDSSSNYSSRLLLLESERNDFFSPESEMPGIPEMDSDTLSNDNDGSMSSAATAIVRNGRTSSNSSNGSNNFGSRGTPDYYAANVSDNSSFNLQKLLSNELVTSDYHRQDNRIVKEVNKYKIDIGSPSSNGVSANGSSNLVTATKENKGGFPIKRNKLFPEFRTARIDPSVFRSDDRSLPNSAAIYRTDVEIMKENERVNGRSSNGDLLGNDKMRQSHYSHNRLNDVTTSTILQAGSMQDDDYYFDNVSSPEYFNSENGSYDRSLNSPISSPEPFNDFPLRLNNSVLKGEQESAKQDLNVIRCKNNESAYPSAIQRANRAKMENVEIRNSNRFTATSDNLNSRRDILQPPEASSSTNKCKIIRPLIVEDKLGFTFPFLSSFSKEDASSSHNDDKINSPEHKLSTNDRNDVSTGKRRRLDDSSSSRINQVDCSYQTEDIENDTRNFKNRSFMNSITLSDKISFDKSPLYKTNMKDIEADNRRKR